jgi:hypothetical protein
VEIFEDPIADTGIDAWLAVSDDLLWGFNHALSNRLAAISSITRILEYSDTGLDPLLAALSEEIETLERTLKLLRLVPRSPRSTAEPVLLNELVPEVVRLHGVRSDATDLRMETYFDDGLQPVWVDPARLSHALLIVFAAVSRFAYRSGERAIAVRAGSTAELATIGFTTPSGVGAPSLSASFDPAEVAMVRRLIAEGGGELRDAESDPPGVELRLPTLLAVRERERNR